LIQQHLPEFIPENLKLRDHALKYVMKKFQKVCLNDKENSRFYEDFLIRNFEMDKIEDFAHFIDGEIREDESEEEQESISRLKNIVFDFVWKNYKEIKENGFQKNFPNDFLLNLVEYMSEKLVDSGNKETNIQEDEPREEDNKSKTQPKKNGKRREPIQKDDSEEKSTLKKTKK